MSGTATIFLDARDGADRNFPEWMIAGCQTMDDKSFSWQFTTEDVYYNQPLKLGPIDCSGVEYICDMAFGDHDGYTHHLEKVFAHDSKNAQKKNVQKLIQQLEENKIAGDPETIAASQKKLNDEYDPYSITMIVKSTPLPGTNKDTVIQLLMFRTECPPILQFF